MTTIYQTRNEDGEVLRHPDLKAAFDHACADPTVWKVSYFGDHVHRRLIRQIGGVWLHESTLSKEFMEFLTQKAS
jgi:hypothetical protein